MLSRHTKSPAGFSVCYPLISSWVQDSTGLSVIASHMRRGRQEDSHEFLRYAIDAIQKSCLAGHPSLVLLFVGPNCVSC